MYRVTCGLGPGAEGLTQAAIGARIGWSREAVRNYVFLIDKVGTDILVLAEQHQKGRVPNNGTIVPFDFTEGWFRNSGLYDKVGAQVLDLAEAHLVAKGRERQAQTLKQNTDTVLSRDDKTVEETPSHNTQKEIAKAAARHRIFDLWMQCWTQEQIAEEVGCSRQTVDALLPEMANLPKLAKSDQSYAEHATTHPSRNAAGCGTPTNHRNHCRSAQT